MTRIRIRPPFGLQDYGNFPAGFQPFSAMLQSARGKSPFFGAF
jgi:hypothetical protein